MEQKVDRSKVREFFLYDEHEETTVPWLIPFLVFYAIAVVFLYQIQPNWGVITAIIGAVGGYLAYQAAVQHGDATRDREFEKLAAETRKIQARDVVKGFTRIFERSQLDISNLRILEHRYNLEKERQLFPEDDDLSSKLGDLLNRSIRLFSHSDSRFNSHVRQGKINKKKETFFNPTRVVSLFLTRQELIICDIEIDSIDGDLKEKINRIMLSDVVSVGFGSERVRFSIKDDDIIQIARDLGHSEAEIDQWKETLNSENRETSSQKPKFVQEEMTSRLEISRTDGQTLLFPIKSEFIIGKHESALDQDTSLTDDEITVDRMVNELNRVVREARFPDKQFA